MNERRSYEPVLSSQAIGLLMSLTKARQQKLIQLLRQLAETPGQVDDYFEFDDTGRDIQFILIRDFLIAYWADHAVREFRIVRIDEA